MARPFDPAALRRLNASLHAGRGLTQPLGARMGRESGLDGLRAVAVLLLLLHHLHLLQIGPSWFEGGFVGVELLFVVVGYLVTIRLLEEWERDGRIAVGEAIVDRLRRQLPLVVLMLVTVGGAAAIWRSDTLSDLRADIVPALFSLSNWREVWDHVDHFAVRDPQPLLHHLWPVAVELQWMILWPVVLFAVLRWVRGGLRQARIVMLVAAVASALLMALLYREFDSFRVDLAYLATFTRLSGLLLGATLATLWTPWRWHGAGRRPLPLLDGAAVLALAALVALVVRLHQATPGMARTRLFVVAGPAVLPGGLAAAAVASVALVAAAVHPGAVLAHQVLGWRWLAEAGRRAFVFYLWHWPMLVLLRADESMIRLVLALLVSAGLAEATYRYVERPLGGGALGAWIASWRSAEGSERRDYTVSSVLYGVAALSLVGAVAVRVARVDSVDVSIDPTIAEFDATAILKQVAGPAVTVASAPSTTAPELPRTLLVVGDLQGHSLVVNRPAGIEGTFDISDHTDPGCGVFDSGSLVTERRGVRHRYAACAGWSRAWGDAARAEQPAVTLVVVGAWDVFDVQDGDTSLTFGSAEFDQRFLAKLDLGVEALKAAGSKVALLEVPCFRPVDVAEADSVALPERGDDRRVAHLNDLLRRAAADDPAAVTFVPGATEWCADPVIAADRAYRWNGVEYYKPGAKLQFETIAATLVRIPV